ncbi:hypothetical protein WR25_09696 [Diploscapter pachys]|uniref:Uncharacterized protein n=1 Tax=Diploscapter pachys TaxID=2018661 RepID=A0A2A2K2U4_9BILA|nr:hypothetical protein WR25_09696 [Diploscapter pachys]
MASARAISATCLHRSDGPVDRGVEQLQPVGREIGKAVVAHEQHNAPGRCERFIVHRCAGLIAEDRHLFRLAVDRRDDRGAQARFAPAHRGLTGVDVDDPRRQAGGHRLRRVDDPEIAFLLRLAEIAVVSLAGHGEIVEQVVFPGDQRHRQASPAGFDRLGRHRGRDHDQRRFARGQRVRRLVGEANREPSCSQPVADRQVASHRRAALLDDQHGDPFARRRRGCDHRGTERPQDKAVPAHQKAKLIVELERHPPPGETRVIGHEGIRDDVIGQPEAVGAVARPPPYIAPARAQPQAIVACDRADVIGGRQRRGMRRDIGELLACEDRVLGGARIGIGIAANQAEGPGDLPGHVQLDPARDRPARAAVEREDVRRAPHEARLRYERPSGQVGVGDEGPLASGTLVEADQSSTRHHDPAVTEMDRILPE